MIKEPYCTFCKHFEYDDEKGAMCKAFSILKKWHDTQLIPTCIPPEIYSGEINHNEPYEGDHGIQFEPKE